MHRLYKNWPAHNILGHPLMEILNWIGLRRVSRWVHDVTLPPEPNKTNETNETANGPETP